MILRFQAVPLFFVTVLVLINSASLSLAAERVLKVVYAASWAPISVGEGDKVSGILPDLVETYVHKGLGIKVDHIGVPWARAQEMVRSGQADAFITTATPERLEFTTASQEPIYQLAFKPVVRRGEGTRFVTETALTRMKNLRFCDVLGNGWARDFYEKLNIKFYVAQTLDQCLRQLVNKRTDVIIHAAPVAEDFIKKMGISGQVEIINLTMESSPSFPFLLSSKSDFGQDLLDDLDTVVRNQMINSVEPLSAGPSPNK